MANACPVESFFPNLPEEHKVLFADADEVWDVLQGLKNYLRQVIEPRIGAFCEPGVPLSRHVALLPSGWLTGGFEVICSDSTRGRAEVWIGGKPAPEASLLCGGAVFMDAQIQIGVGVVVEPGALIKGPTIIGDRTEIRQGAYIRGDCLVGSGCVVGHVTEVKHSVFLDGAKAGHFAYVGDSLLGRDVNLGAGTKLANLRFYPGNVVLRIRGSAVDTGLRKLGAILGNGVQTGCNSVTNPGVLLGEGSLVAPNVTVSPGFYPRRSIIR